GLGLYYLDKKGWTFIAAAEESNPKKFSSRVTSMEKFTLIRDTIPPVVMPLQPVKNKVIISRNGMVSFMVKDEMCGIRNESQINFYINGNWQLFDFDPEEDVVTLSLHDDIRKPAALLIEVEDNCGNTTLREYIIQ
ncbi:MAG: hypothetical protein JXL67_08935, partial [Calditrichaeota bacterium]|nr:hypothetical protein [Calditrichota bacterium]